MNAPMPAELLDRALVRAMQAGLPRVARPYYAIAEALGVAPEMVMTRIGAMLESGAIRRIGAVPNHYRLGWTANGMSVWDVDDDAVDALGALVGALPFVSHCYRRPRRLPQWRYNLYCMIHGKSRDEVQAHLAHMIQSCGLQDLPHEVLFSKRRFKQRGAAYFAKPAMVEA